MKREGDPFRRRIKNEKKQENSNLVADTIKTDQAFLPACGKTGRCQDAGRDAGGD